MAEDCDRAEGAYEHFSVANGRNNKFNGAANTTRIEELGLEIGCVVGMQDGEAIVLLIGPNNAIAGKMLSSSTQNIG